MDCFGRFQHALGIALEVFRLRAYLLGDFGIAARDGTHSPLKN
jgi:hypothetical protein